MISLEVAKKNKFNLKISVQILKIFANSKWLEIRVKVMGAQKFYACASAFPQVLIPESLSILAQTIW